MSTPLLEVRVAHKRFGDKTVLQNLRLSLQPGEVVTLVGASGCGKSTLLRLVAGLDTDFDGEVRLHGDPLTGPTRGIRFVFQEPRLFPWLSVARNIAFDAEGREDPAPRVAELLREVGLEGGPRRPGRGPAQAALRRPGAARGHRARALHPAGAAAAR
jgi:sulfonate transport system ATP-binding protein